MGLEKKLSQLMDCPLPTNNTHIIMSTKIARRVWNPIDFQGQRSMSPGQMFTA
jgi:hypothetical protein